MLPFPPTSFKSRSAASHCSYQKDKLTAATQWIPPTSSQTHLVSHPAPPTPSTSPATQACFPTFKPVMAHSSAGLDTGWKAIFLLHITELTLHQPAGSSSRDTFPEKSAPITLWSRVKFFYYKLQKHHVLPLLAPSLLFTFFL